MAFWKRCLEQGVLDGGRGWRGGTKASGKREARMEEGGRDEEGVRMEG